MNVLSNQTTVSADTLASVCARVRVRSQASIRDVQIIQGIHGYSDGGVGSQASMDDPGMFRVSRESTDTLTGGGGEGGG